MGAAEAVPKIPPGIDGTQPATCSYFISDVRLWQTLAPFCNTRDSSAIVTVTLVSNVDLYQYAVYQL